MMRRRTAQIGADFSLWPVIMRLLGRPSRAGALRVRVAEIIWTNGLTATQ